MVKAIHNNVVLTKKEQQKVNGIYMSNMGEDAYVVLNVGSEVSTIKVGETVVLKNAPTLYLHNNQKYYITNIENIIAIVEESNE